jgi:hypothetical protein
VKNRIALQEENVREQQMAGKMNAVVSVKDNYRSKFP